MSNDLRLPRMHYLAGLGLLSALTGCAAWGPNTATTGLPLFDTPADSLSEPELPSSRATPTLDRGSVVRYQNPQTSSTYGPYYGAPPAQAGFTQNNQYAGASDEHLRQPMTAHGAGSHTASQIPATAAPTGQVAPAQFSQDVGRGRQAWGMPPGAPQSTGQPSQSVYPAIGNSNSGNPNSGNPNSGNPNLPGNHYGGMPVQQVPSTVPQGYASPAQAFATPPPGATVPYAAPAGTAVPPQWQGAPGPPPSTINAPFGPPVGGNPVGLPQFGGPTLPAQPPLPFTDVIVNVQETQTGRLMFGAAVNSDAGVTGQIVLDEKNFDWRRFPRSFDDFANGTAFRGDGQGFRLEAMPGNRVQRYSASFTDPYFLDTQWTFNLSGFLFDRNYFDWDEQRLGGRIGIGRRITPDLSLLFSTRLENVEISDPRVPGVPELDAVIGDHDLFSGKVALTQDTRDIPFAPTQGYYLELAFEQVFGSFDYSRGTVDFRRFFLITQRPDMSGRHVLSFANRLGITGSQTPIFENFFAGGVGTLRGFDFRGASPLFGGVTVGGELSFLGSVEYRFPITADDMIQGVVFCDYGTIEEEIEINTDDYRVALGAGLRINVPAMGPAPIAIDFAVPVAREDTDDIRQFSFFVGGGRF